MNEREHLSIETMDAYCGDLLSPEDVYTVDTHLSICVECAQKIRVLREFNLYWETWTPERHGAAYREAQLESIIETALANNPAMGTRLREWAHQWGIRAGAAVKILWKLPDEITRVVDERLDNLLPLIPNAPFSPVTAPARVTGIKDDRMQPPVIDGTKARMSGEIFVEVSLDESQGVIEVYLRGIRQSPPLVLLVSETHPEMVMAHLPEYQLETNCFICRFEQAPSGNYIILLEPWE